ncbi:MAG: DNA-binding response regulator [Firmicutes bacterium]|nr:DNA-binding response regulator [Bacillota bacterium]
MSFSIWIVDDDPAMLSMLSECARDAGWQCQTYSSVTEVERALARGAGRPDVVVADWTLPDGPVLSLYELAAPARWVIMSGDPAVALALPESVRWLEKPFRLLDFFRVVTSPEE